MSLNAVGVKALLLRLWRSATQRVMSLKFGGMLLGLLMDVLIAARFGTSGTADALIVALTLPLFVDTVTRESSNFSLVPIFVERRENSSARRYSEFVSGLFNFALVLGAVLALAAVLLAPWIVNLLGPGLPARETRRCVTLLRAAAPMLALAPAITLHGVFLDSEKQFSVVALRNAVVPGTVVLALWLAWSGEDTALWVAVGYSTGFALFFLFLRWRARAEGHRHHVGAWPDRSDFYALRGALGWPTAGFVVRQGARMVERALASLAAVGGVAAYYYSLRLVSGFQTLVGASIAITGLPSLSRLGLEGESEEYSSVIRKRTSWVMAFSIPVVLVLVLGHEQIIQLIYGRGSFDSESVRAAGSVLFWLSLGLLFTTLAPVLNASLYARREYTLVFGNMVLASAVHIMGAWLLSDRLGLIGIAIASSAAAMVACLNLVRMHEKRGVRVLPRGWRVGAGE